MLRSMNDLEEYAIHATDGEIGRLQDFTFDDKAWVVRYFVVDVGSWSASRKVLISTLSIHHSDWSEKTFPVSITRKQVEDSPAFDIQTPLSRKQEVEYLGYYNYPYYWGGTGLWGGETYPDRFSTGSGGFEAAPFILNAPSRDREDVDVEVPSHLQHDLRSGITLKGNDVVAADGDIGKITDLLIDEETWAIRYLVVETGDWWPGHQVLIAPQWIDEVYWTDSSIRIGMARWQVKDAPHYDPMVNIQRQNEMETHQHYGRIGYWVDEVERDKPLPIG